MFQKNPVLELKFWGQFFGLFGYGVANHALADWQAVIICFLLIWEFDRPCTFCPPEWQSHALKSVNGGQTRVPMGLNPNLTNVKFSQHCCSQSRRQAVHSSTDRAGQPNRR